MTVVSEGVATEDSHADVYVALATPFDESTGEVDYQRLTEFVKYMATTGVSGFVPCGSTGEFTKLTAAERSEIASTVVEATAGKLATVPQTGSLSTAEAIKLSKDAAKDGASGLLVVAPFYEPLSFDGILAYYSAISDACELPITYYHFPHATGVDLTVEQIVRLSTETRVNSIKDSTGDFVKLGALSREHGEQVRVFNGLDAVIFEALAGGVNGFILGSANLVPAGIVRLVQTMLVGQDLTDGRELWRELWPLCRFLETCGAYASAVKDGALELGVKLGPTRLPDSGLSADQRRKLFEILSALPKSLAIHAS